MSRFNIFVRLTALALGVSAPLAAFSQAGGKSTYPVRPVRVIVGYTPGGATDYTARLVATHLSGRWGQPVVVENRPGSSTLLAVDLLKNAPADGHTILLADATTMTVNPHAFAKLPYDPVKDFAPVTQLLFVPVVLLAHPSVSANNLAELVALAKTKPGALNYGSYGNGTVPHLAFELLKAKAGIDITHVPYKGVAETAAATIAGHVQLTVSSIVSGVPHARAGRVKMLAWGGLKRSPLIPEVPTFAEQGYAEVPANSWYGLFVRSGTPRELISYIHRETVQMYSDPALVDREIVAKGYELVANSPEEFTAFLREDMVNRGRAVKASGARPE